MKTLEQIKKEFLDKEPGDFCNEKGFISMEKVADHIIDIVIKERNRIGKCHCDNIKMGTYKNTVLMSLLGGQIVTIDTCIATEIGYLWNNGIGTLNSCCGHRKIRPTVIVTEESINKMIELGYKKVIEEVALPDQTFYLGNI